MGIAIELRHVSKSFSNASYQAVDEINITIEEGEFITILGSSGCGKTTLLKLINRLYEPDSGSIFYFGEDSKNQEAIALRRKIGYVIQQGGLFPHMTIYDNVATVPKILKWPKEKIEKRVEELLHLVGLNPEEFASRYPSKLSGGEQQRVGIARALAADPKIMLLDEPFGAIDAITRGNLQNELMAIHKESKKTYLFVTHDIKEAFKLGSRVLLMDQGRVQQFDTPDRILLHPANLFVEKLLASVMEQERFWLKNTEGIHV